MRVQEPFCTECGREAQARGLCPTHYQIFRKTTPKDLRSPPRNGARHGMAYTPIYHTWVGMRQRCRDENTPAYKNYGGRGIRVCDRWLVFENFMEDMGLPQRGYELDRINNDGDYEPGNCRWVPRAVNSRNKRTSSIVEFNGERKCLSDWAVQLGMSRAALRWRIVNWGVEKAITAQKINSLDKNRTEPSCL